MYRLLSAPVAELLKFNFSLHGFLVFIGVIITPLADSAAECDQSIGAFHLGHGNYNSASSKKWQLLPP